MIYEWRCDNCGNITEIERPLKDYQVPPDKCSTCGAVGETLTKTLSSPPIANRTLAWGKKGRWSKYDHEP